LTPIIKAGLYIWNDSFEEAHLIAQGDGTVDGCLWHAILHRREGNFVNSKYWYRQLGEHPLFNVIRDKIPAWDPSLFVDDCEKAISKEDFSKIAELETIQMIEFKAFYHYLCNRTGL